MTNKKVYTLLSVFALVVVGFGTYAHTTLDLTYNTAAVACALEHMPDVTARAAYVYDVESDTALFEKNATAQLPLASVTKLATALVATEELDSESTITLSDYALEPEGDSGLFAGEVWRAQDLLAFTLITSSNDGARALALKAGSGSLETFVEKMNALAQRAGLTQTYFLNETGLDISLTTAGSYGSARDMAHLLAYAYRTNPDALTSSSQSHAVYYSLSGVEHVAEHTSPIAGSIPGEMVVKTGFTDLAGGNLAVLVELFPGKPVAIVVLGATRETRDQDVATLAKAAKDALERVTLCNNAL